MRILKTLKPGQDGTKELLARFGASLLCVRYRYDEANRERLKTVELIVKRRSADPPQDKRSTRRVWLRVGWREMELRHRVKAAGGRWDPVRRVWVLRRAAAERLDLLDRVVGDGHGGS